MAEPLVRFDNVTRRFGELVAVDSVSLELSSGEVLALLGENGAGKSTLMKLLFGLYPPSEGRILVDGEPSPVANPSDAARFGIGMVFQHFSLLPALSVRDNLLLAWPQTPYWKSPRNCRTAPVTARLSELAPQIAPNRRVGDLSVGEQQIVELSKVLNLDARIVILDEPTSVLTPAETTRLHGFIRQLAAQGVAVVLITHKLADVEACADRIAIMRRGKVVDVSVAGERSTPAIVTLMMGQDIERTPTRPAAPAARGPRLEIRHLHAEAAGMALRDVLLSISAGEVMGIAGVAGNGQALLAEAIAGIATVSAGDVLLDGESIARHSPFDAIFTPIGYIPEQPRQSGVVETMTLAQNLALRELAAGRPPLRNAAAVLTRFNVNPPEPARLAATLSGGNVQKLVIARELGVPRRALLACYPTMGLDLSAIERVYGAMLAQASDGAAVLWISEDLDDLLATAHRIAVMREGRIVAILENDGRLTRDIVGAWMTGVSGVGDVA